MAHSHQVDRYDHVLYADDRLTEFFSNVKGQINNLRRDVNDDYIPPKLNPATIDVFIGDMLGYHDIRQLYLILNEVPRGYKKYLSLVKDFAGKCLLFRIIPPKSHSTLIKPPTVIDNILTQSIIPLLHLDEETVDSAKELFQKKLKTKGSKTVPDSRITLLDKASASPIQVIFTKHHI